MKNKDIRIATAVSITVASFNAIFLLVFAWLTLHLRDIFLQIYDGFAVTLPSLTQMFINMNGGIWAQITFILITLLTAKEMIATKWIPLLLNGIFSIGLLAYWIIFQTAMLIPLLMLVDQMKNG